VGLRIGQERNEREQFDEGARPAVSEDQRYPPAASRPLVDEVDPDPVELGAEVRERVQFSLLRAPVVLAGPVREQLAQVLEVGALLPSGARRRVGPAGVADARPQVGQYALVDLDREGLSYQGWTA
jgi:hypothetical protein